jgi:hypothetical protein
VLPGGQSSRRLLPALAGCKKITDFLDPARGPRN